MNWKLKDITEKQLQEAKNPLTQDHVTAHRTDWLFISNCEPIAEMKRLRSGQMKGLGNVKSLCSTPPHPTPKTVPPKISTCWDTEADYQRMKTTWEMESGVISKWKASDEGSRGKLMVQKRKMNRWKGPSEGIFCTELVWIRKEKGDNTLPAGEWRFS